MYQPKVFLVVMDGWGYSEVQEGNAIAGAAKPNFDKLWQYYPHALIEAAGEPVGLPWGNIGSSEVGHTCLGSGRIINQDLPRVSRSITSGEFFRNSVLIEAINYAKRNNSSLHLVGLVSAGGVHSHIDHLFALLTLLGQHHFRQPVYIQMFTDGRDTPVKTSILYIDKLNERIQALHLNAQIASIIGRYYAMDRDSHWERTLAAYDCLVSGSRETAESPQEAVVRAYARGETDEFIKPTTILSSPSQPSIIGKLFSKNPPEKSQKPGLIKNKDAVIFFNFRPERMRQLVETFMVPQQKYPDKILLKNLYVASIVEYEKSLPIRVVLPTEKIENPLAKVLSDHGLVQLHITETEKYAHGTYFFDGGNPVPFKNEDWIVIRSPRVATYDLKPEMSAAKITDKIFELSEKKLYDFVLINFANADMVGHTGNLKATVKAIEAVDRELGRLTTKFPESIFLITADHGNAEKMINSQTGEIDTEHSVSPVPFILVGLQFQKNTAEQDQTKPVGILADIAPTVLDLLNVSIPSEMTGYSLLKSVV